MSIRPLTRVLSLELELHKDPIRVQDPHVKAGEVKMLTSSDLFAFTCVGVRGLIVKGQELGVYKSARSSELPLRACPRAAGPA